MQPATSPALWCCMLVFVGGSLATIVVGAMTIGKSQSYLAYSRDGKILFRKPIGLCLIGVILSATFIAGAQVMILTQPPEQQSQGWIVYLLVGPLALLLLGLLGPESLELDLDRCQYSSVKSWLRLKKTGPMADLVSLRIVTFINQSASTTQYVCKLDWTSGGKTVVGNFQKMEETESLAQQVTTILKIPRLYDEQKF